MIPPSPPLATITALKGSGEPEATLETGFDIRCDRASGVSGDVVLAPRDDSRGVRRASDDSQEGTEVADAVGFALQ